MEGSERLHTAVEIESLSKERLGPGLSLRQARERCRLSVASIADTLHLEPRVIEALESDDYSQLPPVTYVRGYLSAYARLVNLPVANVLQAFERVGGEEHSRPLTLAVGRTGTRSVARFSIGSSWLLVLAFVAVLVSGWMFWMQSQSTPEAASAGENEVEPGTTTGREAATAKAGSDTTPNPTGESDATAAALLAQHAETAVGTRQPPVPSADRPSRGPHASGAATTGNTSAMPPTLQQEGPLVPAAASRTVDLADRKPAADGATTTQTASASSTPQRAGTLETLKFDASGESWVAVEAAGGRRLLYALLEQGESRRVTGRPPFSITIGDTTQVMLRHNGTRVDLVPYTHGKVARFTLSATHD